MKTRVLIAASLITSTLAFVPTTSVNAEGVVAAEIIQSYESAGAGFFSTDASGCVYTSVSASGIDFVIQKPPGPPEPVSDTFIGITKFDDCTQTRLMDATCSSLLAGPDFQVVGSLHSATLDTDLECFDFISRVHFDVSVQLTWTGIGNLDRANGHYHFRTPIANTNSHFNGAARFAVASGSVVQAGGANFTPNPTDFAFMHVLQNGQTTALH